MFLKHQWDQLDSVYQYNWNFSNLEVSYNSVVFAISSPYFSLDYDVFFFQIITTM